MALGFVPSESAFAYFEVLQRYLETHGKPVAFYSDKHSIFRVSKAEAAGGDGAPALVRMQAVLGAVGLVTLRKRRSEEVAESERGGPPRA